MSYDIASDEVISRTLKMGVISRHKGAKGINSKKIYLALLKTRPWTTWIISKNEISTRVWVKGTPSSAQNNFSKLHFKSSKLCSEEHNLKASDRKIGWDLGNAAIINMCKGNQNSNIILDVIQHLLRGL